MSSIRPTFTLGIEEEFQIIDPQTRELRSHVQEIMEGGKKVLQERIKPELHQSVVELASNLCHNIAEARSDVTETRTFLINAANASGLKVAAAGTHPFSNWADQTITPDPRYSEIIDELQVVARANLIFGLHVHVGIEDRELAIQIMNEMRYFLPHILALSTNSPFWMGRNTGLKSYRTKIFDKFPRTGIPDLWHSVADFDEYVQILIRTKCIDNGRKIWWDIRPHPFYPTIEVRICDIPMRLDETICLAAIIQALAVKLYKLRERNLGFRQYRRALLLENKWRASRWGVQGKLIDFGKAEEVPFSQLLLELLDFISDVVPELGSEKEVAYVHEIMRRGSGADRQLRVFEETGGDLRKVVDYIVEETAYGIQRT